MTFNINPMFSNPSLTMESYVSTVASKLACWHGGHVFKSPGFLKWVLGNILGSKVTGMISTTPPI